MNSLECEDCNHEDIPRYYAYGGEVHEQLEDIKPIKNIEPLKTEGEE